MPLFNPYAQSFPQPGLRPGIALSQFKTIFQFSFCLITSASPAFDSNPFTNTLQAQEFHPANPSPQFYMPNSFGQQQQQQQQSLKFSQGSNSMNLPPNTAQSSTTFYPSQQQRFPSNQAMTQKPVFHHPPTTLPHQVCYHGN